MVLKKFRNFGFTAKEINSMFTCFYIGMGKVKNGKISLKSCISVNVCSIFKMENI